MTSAARATLLAVGLLVVGAALTACGTTSPNDAASTAGSAGSETSGAAAAESTETPAASTTTEAGDPGCSTVLTEAAIAQLEADGLELVDVGASTFYPIADDLVEAGGVACRWGRPASDANITVVQLTGVDVAASEWPAALANAGYTQTDDPVAGAYSGPADPGTGVPSVVVVESDRLTFVSAPPHAADIAPAP